MSRLKALRELLLRASLWPTFEDEERTQKARAFHGVAWWTLFVITFFLLLMAAMQPHTLARRASSIALLTTWFLGLLWLNRRGHVRLASWLLVFGQYGLVTFRAYTTGGATAPALSLFVYICMIAGTLLGTRGGVVSGLVLSGTGLWLALLGQAGRLPPLPPQLAFTPMVGWLYSCMALSLSVLLHPQITRALSSSLKRAQAEIAARDQAEQRLRIALDAGSIGVWDRDLRTGQLTADHRLLELYDLTPNAAGLISYEIWLGRVHPDDRVELEESLLALGLGKLASTQREFRIVLQTGRIRYLFGAANAVKNARGEVVRIVGVNRDITERMLADEERQHLVHDLGERVKELRLLHQVARLVQQGSVTDSELFQELVTGIPLAWQFTETCEARITYRGIVATTPGFRDSLWRQSEAFSTSDGSGLIEVVYLEYRPDSDEGPFLNEERALLESLAELLVSHMELRKHQEHLEQLVSTRTREMQRAKEEAERASRAKTTFLATMSHEIRTPMNAILGYAQLLRRDSQLAPTQQAQVDTILSSGEHLLTLINDVLEMSKIEAGRAMLAPETIELPSLLQGIQPMFAALARAKGLSLTFQLSPELPRLVEADPGKLRQVVINLLSNAVKFTAQGGVSVRATLERRTAHGYALKVVVDDTGPGIEPGDLERIFRTFEQTIAGARSGGTGLGLSIGRHLARMMGGDLNATSGSGFGSSFVFTFEVAAPSSQARVKLLRGRVLGLKPRQRKHKVLVVDDVPDNVNLAVSLLRAVGFEVQAASSGEAGLELHDAWHPDLVLMDLRMPGMGGLTAIRRLHAAGSSAVLVAFTASGFEELGCAARAAGAKEVVFKPYRETDLLETIAALLGLDLTYEGNGMEQMAAEPAAAASLASLLEGLPASLRQQLSEAVVQARAQRIEVLADEVSVFSSEAANQLRELVRDFRYDDLASALNERR
ncbi:MAG: ATP-binding protein [Polyangiaceae bacterium]